MTWREFEERARPEFDAERQPVLMAPDGNDTVELGITRKSLESEDAPWGLQRGLMITRMKQTLAHSRAPRISSEELHEDWQLLEGIDQARLQKLSKKLDEGNQSVTQRTERTSD
jgi:hypothetical protein